ncbi:unnamed protein product [Cylindrotheca closterium]|uniref:PDZ domain-containing protein n=1 Tax=Cylindrotheca closterium TaxID=2856 RepID=A0AAD2CGU7_9STRA|nr:unnamed protein product [Cylindrotheca closterium]
MRKAVHFKILILCVCHFAASTLALQPAVPIQPVGLARHHQKQSSSTARWAQWKDNRMEETSQVCSSPNPLVKLLRDGPAVVFASMIIFFSAASPSSVVPNMSSMAWAETETTTTTVTTESKLLEPSSITKESSVIEEVWNLINKYYIERSFNHQDWNAVKQKYVDPNAKVDNEKAMKLTTEMVQSLGDKYTRILDTQQYAAIQKYDLIGVGVTLMPNPQKEIIVGGPPIEGSQAAKVGLLPGDYITAVNGLPTSGRTAFDIIDQISEAPNSKTVTFTVRRQGDKDLAGEGSKFDVTMERQTMQVKDPVQYKLSEQRKDGTNVGYIRVSEFNSLVNAKLQDALQDLKAQGANAYVLDLRSNTGGAFQSAVEISGLFFEDRVATYVLDSNNVELPFRTTTGKVAIDPEAPMVVWIDGMSASASEVLAGSLHDNCRAVTMGDQSFGKGLIQAVYGLKNGAGLVLTVARYVTPNGTDIQGTGITPDIKGEMPAPVQIPVLSSNTAKVDFNDIRQKLDPSMCAIPQDRVQAQTAVQ